MVLAPLVNSSGKKPNEKPKQQNQKTKSIMTLLPLETTCLSRQNVPDEFVCPISLEVMKDPVMSRSGQNYDRRAILEWLYQGNTNCPLTRQPLKPSFLVPNNCLKMMILKWKQENVNSDELSFDESERTSCSNNFVGLLSMDESSRSEATAAGASANPYNSQVDDELSDLLDLYNEVLALTAFNVTNATASPPPSEQESLSSRSSSLEEHNDDDAVLDTIRITKNNKRRWRPKLLFYKKK